MWDNNQRFFQIAGFLLAGFTMPNVYGAATSDNDFKDYMRERCQDTRFTEVDDGSETFRNYQSCLAIFQGVFGIEVDGRSNIVIAHPGEGPQGGVKGRLDQVSVGGSGATVSAGAEDGGFGILISAISGETERSETELESGFDSDQSGLLAGIDYRFSDAFVLGIAAGSVEDEAVIANDAGELKTESDSQTVYATWSVTDGLSLDFYYGNADSDIDIQRNFEFTTTNASIVGVINGAYEASQTLQGFSINYDWYLGPWSLGLMAAMDKIETETDAYDEAGRRTNSPEAGEIGTPLQGEPTGFELHYPSQEIESSTTSIGLRIGYGAEFGWGVLLPNVKVLSVRENENDAREIGVSLVTDPNAPAPFIVGTDAPDRNYTTTGAGLIAAFNNGSQVFVDYEQRSGHEFINTSSVTLGALIAF